MVKGQGKVLVVEDEREVAEILAMLIEDVMETEVVFAHSGNSAIELLKNVQDISIIFCDYNMPDGNGGVVYTYNKENSNVPFIHCSTEPIERIKEYSSFETDNILNSILEKPFDEEELEKIVNSVFESDGCESSHHENNLVRISIERFARFEQDIEDVFLKLSEVKFIKIAGSGKDLDRKQLEKYQDKGNGFIFIKSENYNKITSRIFSGLVNKLESQEISEVAKADIQLLTSDEVREAVKVMGITDEVIKTTDALVKSTISVLKVGKSFKSLIKKILTGDSYIRNHTQLMNYICIGMANKLNWDSKETLTKFVLSSILCDISFENSDLAIIQGGEDPLFNKLEEKEKSEVRGHLENPIIGKLTYKEKKEVEGHIQKSVEILKKEVNGIVADEITMMSMHHELPDGSGYPRGLNSHNIPPLAAAFILAHEFAYQYIVASADARADFSIIIEMMGPSFAQNNFSKSHAALLSLLKLNEFTFKKRAS